MKSKATSEFWQCFDALPPQIQALARKNFRLWQANPRHPSLRFRPHSQGNWSARAGDHYCAVAHRAGEVFVWLWIGSHE